MTEAELTAYEADVYARGQKTLAEMAITMGKPISTRERTNKELAEFLYQVADTGDLYWQNGGDVMLRDAGQRLEALDGPRAGLCGDLRIAAVVLRETGYPTGASTCISAAVCLDRLIKAASEYQAARKTHDEIRQQRPIHADNLNASTDRVKTASSNLDAALRAAGIETEG